MKKKTVALVLACVLVFGMATGGTLAFLKAKTDTKTNTFTVGDIGALSLTETEVEKYLIVPGVNITKDPKVSYTVEDGDDVAVYIFVKVDAADWTAASGNMSFSQSTTSASPAVSFEIDEAWTYLTTETTSYVYYLELAANEALTAQSVIKNDTVAVSGSILDTEIEALDEKTLSFTAYAIQKPGFDSVSAAWTAAKA